MNLPKPDDCVARKSISQRTDAADAGTRALALALQRQAAAFLASDGTDVPDPDGAGPVFEVPIADPDRDGLNFIPVPCQTTAP